MTQKEIRVGDIIWAGNPGYVGRVKQINTHTMYLDTCASTWSIMTKKDCYHATESQRKLYFKLALQDTVTYETRLT